MPKGFARIAAVSVPVHLRNVDLTVAQITAAIDRLQAQGVQAAVFPELCLTGCTMGDLFVRQDLCDAAWRGLLTLANHVGDMAVVVGLPVCAQGRLFNCAAVLHRGQVRGLVPKMHLSADARQFESGAGVSLTVALPQGECLLAAHQLFDMDGFTFAVEPGSDLLAPAPASAAYAMHGADVILCPAADPATVGRQAYLSRLIAAHSAQIYAGYALANAGFGEHTADVVYDGATCVYDNGVQLACGPVFDMEDGMAVADIDVSRLRYCRRRAAAARTLCGDMRRVALHGMPDAPLPLMRTVDPLPFVPQGPTAADRQQQIVSIQCAGLVTRLKAISCKDLVIGVSGGLDSTLALLVAVRAFDMLALPRSGIHAITMPGMGTGARTKSNADKLMQALGVSASEIAIGPAVQQHFADIGHDPAVHDVTYENSQARERTQILMDYANKVGGIVLGTGDLSESALGFCTYNGDHMSMYNVNCSVPKTLVRSLVGYLGGYFGGEVDRICRDVLDTPISPELLPVTQGELAQRTEDILGDYALHDFFLYHYISDGADEDRLILLAEHAFRGVYAPDLIRTQLATFLRRFRTQQFKRNCMPDGPKVGTVSLSPRTDWQMP